MTCWLSLTAALLRCRAACDCEAGAAPAWGSRVGRAYSAPAFAHRAPCLLPKLLCAQVTGLVTQRLNAAGAAATPHTADGAAIAANYGQAKVEVQAALQLLRQVKDKATQGPCIVAVLEWLLVSFGRRPEVVKGAKQEWDLIGKVLAEFWPQYSAEGAPCHAELRALYRSYFFEAMRRDAYEVAYDVAKLLPERKELFAELAQWATHRGEPDLAILATKEAGLDLKLFQVDAAFDPEAQLGRMQGIEEKYFNEHALSREEAELYGLWLESEGRYDEALGLYNFQEAHLPNERLLAALAALRDPSMSLTADTQSLDAAVRPSHTPFCRRPQSPAVAHILVPTGNGGLGG